MATKKADPKKAQGRVPPKGGSGTAPAKKAKGDSSTDIPPPCDCDCECCCDDCECNGNWPNPCTEGTFYVKVRQCVEGVKGGCSWLDIDSIVASVLLAMQAKGLIGKE